MQKAPSERAHDSRYRYRYLGNPVETVSSSFNKYSAEVRKFKRLCPGKRWNCVGRFLPQVPAGVMTYEVCQEFSYFHPSILYFLFLFLPCWTIPPYGALGLIAHKFDCVFQYMFDFALQRAISTIQIQADDFSKETKSRKCN